MAAEQMAAINEDLLTLARRGHFNQEPTNMNRLVEQAIAQISQRPPTLGISLELAPELLPVFGSSAQLMRAVSNVLVNARDSMQDAGVLRVCTQNVYVDKPFGRYNRIEIGEYVSVQVSDTGYGIPEEIRNKIFDPFFTTKRADKRRGSGLGLTIVQAIVEDHRGYLDVESELGKGTTFTIYLPVSREAVKAETIDNIPKGSERILVVDDDELQRDAAIRLLQHMGYEVKAVPSGEEALNNLREFPADLMILDMIMPGGIDGLETYRKALKIRPGQKAIIISGFAESENIRQAQALGAGAYLRKPMSLQKLAQAVREELER